jgi:hypothetical protein
MAETEHTIVGAAGIGVVLLDFKRGAVVHQPIEHMRRLPGRRRNHSAAVRAVLVRQVRVEQHAGIGAVFRIDAAVPATTPAGAEILTVRR